MNFKKVLSRSAAALMAVGMAATPVMAEGFTYTAISGTNTTFTKVMSLKEGVKVPNVTYSYAVTAGAAQTAGDGTIAVYAGNDAEKTNGVMPTIADITFSATDAHDAEDATKVTKTATVDFSGVQFKSPGVYRYLVTESGTAQGLTEDASDEDRIKALDVYVIDNDGTLEVAGYILHNNQTDPAQKLTEATTLDDKAAGFEAEYSTNDVTLSKKVAGNQASKEQYFEFTVKITGADANTKYAVDLTNADATTKVTASNAETHTNEAEITTDGEGKATVTYWLQHGQSIKILGFAGETGYSITEANEDYTVSTSKTEGDAAAVTGDSVTVSDDAVTADSTVAYTNTRESVIPTGLFIDAKTGAGIVLFGAALTAGVVIYMKRKNEAEEN